MKDFEKIQKCMQCFRGLKIEVTQFPVEHDDNQAGEIISVNGWINLVPVMSKVNTRTIIGTQTRNAILWNVEVLVHTPGDRETPPEDDYEEVVKGFSLEGACKKAWELITSNEVDHVLENIEMSELADIDATYEKMEGM